MGSRTGTIRCHNDSNNKQGDNSSSTELCRASDPNREIYYVNQEYCFSIMFLYTKSKHVLSLSSSFWLNYRGRRKKVSVRIQDVHCLQFGQQILRENNAFRFLQESVILKSDRCLK